jgi:transcriptional regulator with XRE-family HTH domain
MAPAPTDAVEARLRDLGEFIRDQRRRDRLSLRKLSELAGISNPYLSQIERGLRKPSAEILQAIARGLQISAETLYVRAGILDERDDEQDLVSRILGDPTLTERQKQAMVDIYRSFQREGEPAGVHQGA